MAFGPARPVRPGLTARAWRATGCSLLPSVGLLGGLCPRRWTSSWNSGWMPWRCWRRAFWARILARTPSSLRWCMLWAEWRSTTRLFTLLRYARPFKSPPGQSCQAWPPTVCCSLRPPCLSTSSQGPAGASLCRRLCGSLPAVAAVTGCQRATTSAPSSWRRATSARACLRCARTRCSMTWLRRSQGPC